MKNGIYNNQEFIDTIIVDLNTLIKEVINGQFIQACSSVRDIANKLITLRQSIDNDIKSRNETIEQLKEELKRTGVDIKDIPIEQLIKKDGADNGAE